MRHTFTALAAATLVVAGYIGGVLWGPDGPPRHTYAIAAEGAGMETRHALVLGSIACNLRGQGMDEATVRHWLRVTWDYSEREIRAIIPVVDRFGCDLPTWREVSEARG